MHIELVTGQVEAAHAPAAPKFTVSFNADDEEPERCVVAHTIHLMK